MRAFIAGLLVWLTLLTTLFFFVFQFSLSELLIGAFASSAILFALNRLVCAAPPGTIVRFSWLATVCSIPGATVEGMNLLRSGFPKSGRTKLIFRELPLPPGFSNTNL